MTEIDWVGPEFIRVPGFRKLWGCCRNYGSCGRCTRWIAFHKGYPEFLTMFDDSGQFMICKICRFLWFWSDLVYPSLFSWQGCSKDCHGQIDLGFRSEFISQFMWQFSLFNPEIHVVGSNNWRWNRWLPTMHWAQFCASVLIEPIGPMGAYCRYRPFCSPAIALSNPCDCFANAWTWLWTNVNMPTWLSVIVYFEMFQTTS